jgi:glucan-binding YG repeat protein
MNGLYNINGKTYHFDSQGWMSTGQVVIGRNRFIFEQTPGDAREGALMRIEAA